MSLYGMMRTGVSGMNAQANRLSTVADNIANSSTTGYKRASTEFSSLVLPSTSGSYNSGGVTTTVVNSISKQGALQYTTSVTDLAIDGSGFFVVTDPGGTTYLTRAGSFVPDKDGYLVNTAGYRLQGWDLEWGPRPAELNESLLQPLRINDASQYAAASTSGVFTANLPSESAVVPAANLPSANAGATTAFTAKSSLVAYDGLGSKVILDVYFTKTAAGSWEVAVFDQSQAAAGGFPYASGPLATTTLDFGGTGQLTAGSAKDITVNIPGGGPLTINLSGMSQVDSPYSVGKAILDGNAPSKIERIEIDNDGTVYGVLSSGAMKPLFSIPMANVASPDKLTVVSGNVFSQSADSGSITYGWPTEGKNGKIVAGALEGANVDIAEELTAMIESQRNYTANSKVFQTGADLMDVLVNLKR
ncbi:flagellar hook protein FlgE [Mesorhizobium sp. ANAO-SY3R2]|uniref:flagellar hook protein FlgE n=1 Tax=Mesorhizobium sp. ANAO-SY3R2 TaxID=3166644 RepID=UPI00366AFCAC